MEALLTVALWVIGCAILMNGRWPGRREIPVWILLAGLAMVFIGLWMVADEIDCASLENLDNPDCDPYYELADTRY